MLTLRRALVAVLVAVAGATGQSPADVAEQVYQACVFEDGSGGSTPCVWDGDERGNQTGASYIAWRPGGPYADLP
jgi:hypothetical protein